MLKETHLSPNTISAIIRPYISIIVMKSGMYLAKYNPNDCKSAKTELLDMSNDVGHSITLGWKPHDILRKRRKQDDILNPKLNIGPESLAKLFHSKNYNLRNI